MASTCLVVVITGSDFSMLFYDVCFGGKGAKDVGQLGCKV
jgi:hypothetical protein